MIKYNVYDEKGILQESFVLKEDAIEYVKDDAPERESWIIEEENWLNVENLDNLFAIALLYANGIKIENTEDGSTRAECILNGGSLIAYDGLGGEYSVEITDVVNGLEYAKEWAGNSYQSVILGSYEVYEAYIVLQCIVFGEILYL